MADKIRWDLAELKSGLLHKINPPAVPKAIKPNAEFGRNNDLILPLRIGSMGSYFPSLFSLHKNEGVLK